jgi:cytochrome c-type biogenesis protein CcmH
MKRFFSITLFVLVLAAAWVRVASAQQPTPSADDVNRIARQMYCPVCQNTPLDVCETQACAQWRGLIRDKLAEGWSEDQIKQYFVEQYGARVLAEPPRQGWYLLIYIIPPILLIAGLYILYRVLVTMRKSNTANIQAEAAPSAVGEDEYLQRVEEELKKRK